MRFTSARGNARLAGPSHHGRTVEHAQVILREIGWVSASCLGSLAAAPPHQPTRNLTAPKAKIFAECWRTEQVRRSVYDRLATYDEQVAAPYTNNSRLRIRQAGASVLYLGLYRVLRQFVFKTRDFVSK